MSQLKKEYSCSLELTMNLIGGKWKITILWYLNKGTKRFSELKKLLPGITQKMLTQQLREMEADNLISRKVYAEVPPKVEYSSTNYGKSFDDIIIKMCAWGNSYAGDHEIKVLT